MKTHSRPQLLLFASAAVVACLLSGCALVKRPPGQRSKALLYDAYHAYQAGDNPLALQTVQRAIAAAPRKKASDYLLVELYDDAGLYFYVNGRGREAFIHEAVAVLLAEAIETPESLRKFYRGNLRTAFGASGFALDMDAIEQQPGLLLGIPEVSENRHIKLYYGQTGR